MPLYDNPDQHGADPIAHWLDTPRGDKTHRQRFANLARAFLGCADIAAQIKEAGLDTDDIIASILGICSTAGPPITSRRAYLNFRAGIAATAHHKAPAHLAKIAAVELGPT